MKGKLGRGTKRRKNGDFFPPLLFQIISFYNSLTLVPRVNSLKEVKCISLTAGKIHFIFKEILPLSLFDHTIEYITNEIFKVYVGLDLPTMYPLVPEEK